MEKTILQIPISKELRLRAEAAALEEGFSSLQESVRLFLQKLAKKALSITFYEPPKAVQLSPKAVRRYNKMLDDIEKGRNITKTKNLEELFQLLKS